METEGILRFQEMFNMTNQAQANSPKENSFRRNYTSKNILEITVNCPPAKNYDEQKYKELIAKVISKLGDYIEEDYVYYIEYCRCNKPHLHAKFNIKQDAKFFIEGLVKETAQTILKSIDGRMQLNFDRNYYKYFYRYRSPTMVVQYTDDPVRVLHWDQYIQKNAL